VQSLDLHPALGPIEGSREGQVAVFVLQLQQLKLPCLVVPLDVHCLVATALALAVTTVNSEAPAEHLPAAVLCVLRQVERC
jgi:hypothetical protein